MEWARRSVATHPQKPSVRNQTNRRASREGVRPFSRLKERRGWPEPRLPASYFPPSLEYSELLSRNRLVSLSTAYPSASRIRGLRKWVG